MAGRSSAPAGGAREAARCGAEAMGATRADSTQQHLFVTIALSGGQTLRYLYGLLGATYRAAIPWRKVRLFWGDERYVSPEDPRSLPRGGRQAYRWVARVVVG